MSNWTINKCNLCENVYAARSLYLFHSKMNMNERNVVAGRRQLLYIHEHTHALSPIYVVRFLSNQLEIRLFNVAR